MDDDRLPARPVAEVPEPPLRELYAYWRAIRGHRRYPLRADFDPTDIPQLLPRLFLVDVESDGQGRPSFRYRLAGTGITEFVGRDFTGKRFEDVLPAHVVAMLREVYEPVLHREAPVYSRSIIHLPELVTPKVISRLIVPMTRGGTGIDVLVNAQHYAGDPGELAEPGRFQGYDIVEAFAVEP